MVRRVAIVAACWALCACGEPASSLSGDAASADGGARSVDAAPAVDAGATAPDATAVFPTPVLDDCITSGAAGEHQFTCDWLTYDVSVPEACLAEACGLIIDVHGYSMSGAIEDNNTRMRQLGRDYGYVVVQPNALPAPPLSDWAATDDDDVLAFAERVAAAFHLDEARWYFTGFSQGGFMSWRFVCKYADRFAAIAPVAGCAAGGVNACVLDATDSLPGETHVLYMHGTRDSVISPACIAPQRDSVIAAYEMAEPEVVSEDDQHAHTRWTNPRGMVFELIEHDYESDNLLIRGHCFPGSTDPGGEPGQVTSFACDDAAAFDWGTTAMEFFRAHVRGE